MESDNPLDESQENVITISDDDDLDDNANEMSQAMLDIKMSGLDIKMVKCALIHSELNEEEEENLEAPITSCLFKHFIADERLCSGFHSKKIGLVRCVSKALNHNPFHCWFCQKSRIVASFPTRVDLVEHQEIDHDDDIKRHEYSFVWFETMDYKIDRYIGTYISKRSSHEVMDQAEFSEKMTSKAVPRMKKRRIFTQEFGYAPISCILCEERTKVTGRNNYYLIAMLSKRSERQCKEHLTRYHRLSYNKKSSVRYWFKETCRLEALEEIFNSYFKEPFRNSCNNDCSTTSERNDSDGMEVASEEEVTKEEFFLERTDTVEEEDEKDMPKDVSKVPEETSDHGLEGDIKYESNHTEEAENPDSLNCNYSNPVVKKMEADSSSSFDSLSPISSLSSAVGKSPAGGKSPAVVKQDATDRPVVVRKETADTSAVFQPNDSSRKSKKLFKCNLCEERIISTKQCIYHFDQFHPDDIPCKVPFLIDEKSN